MQLRSKCYGGWPNRETCTVLVVGNVFSDQMSIDLRQALASSIPFRSMGRRLLRQPLDRKIGHVGRHCHGFWQDRETCGVLVHLMLPWTSLRIAGCRKPSSTIPFGSMASRICSWAAKFALWTGEHTGSAMAASQTEKPARFWLVGTRSPMHGPSTGV